VALPLELAITNTKKQLVKLVYLGQVDHTVEARMVELVLGLLI
jgi:hypothetical protein